MRKRIPFWIRSVGGAHLTEVHSSSIGEDFTIEEKIEESLKERSRILEEVMKTNEIFMKMILILFTTSVLGKHARSRKKGSCKPLSGEFKEGFYYFTTIIGGYTLEYYKPAG